MHFASRLRRQRLAEGLSQSQLAYLVGLHHTEISLLEAARRVPLLHTVMKLAVGLEVEPVVFVAGIRWQPPTVGGAPENSG
ncbi:MAG TPA: helix-turn-helix transcriptional regulator [Solirubrobacterales bacterium]